MLTFEKALKCSGEQIICTKTEISINYNSQTVADLRGGAGDARPPLGVQILSISCSFWENLTNLYVGAPPGELAPPPRGNPGSATAKDTLTFNLSSQVEIIEIKNINIHMNRSASLPFDVFLSILT